MIHSAPLTKRLDSGPDPQEAQSSQTDSPAMEQNEGAHEGEASAEAATDQVRTEDSTKGLPKATHAHAHSPRSKRFRNIYKRFVSAATEHQRSSAGDSDQPSSQSQMSAQRTQTQLPRNRIRDRPTQLSSFSSPPINNSLFFANDFMLGAGMVIIQPSSGKVVLVYDTAAKYWFLPRGRKDVGESLEQAALREAYEESGYHVEFLPLLLPTNAPGPPSAPREHQRAYSLPCTEPIYISNTYWSRRRPAQVYETDGGLYLTFWYVGQISDDAVYEEDTGMPDEKSYKSYLLDIHTAVNRLSQYSGPESRIVEVAYASWKETIEAEAKQRALQTGDMSGPGLSVRDCEPTAGNAGHRSWLSLKTVYSNRIGRLQSLRDQESIRDL
ncbi:hypothetical protein NM688_g187 [Phlebia brevispora]|uniref:Uncharacterized protein n=1 Tax=Phlebia brevispora TaxID=194682 RepID=A0ACC1TET3_9APHY|nr:hypothetical protein NM688_g187 [Phlebia brevispora]